MGKLSLSKCQPIEIDADNPFKNDVLGREENITVLTQFITSFEQSIVLCIDGGWGQGKTTFIKMWQQYLKNQHIPTIYFNAWESDYTDDALIALIGEISLAIDNLSGEAESKAKGLLSIIKDKIRYLIKDGSSKEWLTIVSAIGSFISKGHIKADKIAEFATNLNAALAKDQIEKYEKSKQVLLEFKQALSRLAECYSSNEEKKPLVIFIDELDRCRPDFAIEVLEKAKHLFNVDNIIFVLATDKTQLGHSIRAVYGQGLDVNGYLRRFIDFDYLLPLSNQPYIIYLINKFSLEKYFLKTEKHLGDPKFFLQIIVEKYNLSLREQDAFCNIFNIVVRSNATIYLNEWFFFIFIFLIILKIKFPDIYKNLSNRNISYYYNNSFLYDALKNIHSHHTPNDFVANHYLELLEYLLLEVFEKFRIPILDSVEIIENYVEYFKFDKNKKNRLMGIASSFKDNCVSLPLLLDIKKSIEISNSFKFN
ncbi:KAP family P-loop NTPase fold protein [Snodgrassella alvi]|uniref:KAP family P-loop NTPase fold protein n=1 Tax=Snodgrassella alvi TaxID=1196083 RepID=UPI00274275B5|nr:P-loop NTPase fold protein [Snodgrassella alvi]WLT02834.1 P-loop NTPase fold protein [Snodgrassella alvi]